jgi:hypothetical protein
MSGIGTEQVRKVSLSQLYIIPNTERGIVEWQEPVTDEQYKSEDTL